MGRVSRTGNVVVVVADRWACPTTATSRGQPPHKRAGRAMTARRRRRDGGEGGTAARGAAEDLVGPADHVGEPEAAAEGGNRTDDVEGHGPPGRRRATPGPSVGGSGASSRSQTAKQTTPMNSIRVQGMPGVSDDHQPARRPPPAGWASSSAGVRCRRQHRPGCRSGRPRPPVPAVLAVDGGREPAEGGGRRPGVGVGARVPSASRRPGFGGRFGGDDGAMVRTGSR